MTIEIAEGQRFPKQFVNSLLVAGGVVLLRAEDALRRILALDVLVAIVIALLTILSYLRDVSYYVDAVLALALLSFASTLVAARHVVRGDSL